MKSYVLGLAFDNNCENLLLLKKNAPEYQRGKLNGVGGGVETTDESGFHAMAREAREEANLHTDPSMWRHFARMIWEECIVEIYSIRLLRTRTELEELARFQTDEGELVVVSTADVLMRNTPFPVMPNLPWIVAMSFDYSNRALINSIYV